ncbi:Nem1-Spo7 phosphatase regulatory subunit [Friedmanniomyces endolithicus]|uniref:Nem1-Spo7 phosphatase regulatory subunit n=1 Tax=Friedmanniomyces endolithicus TaxID=329885 RepID=A0AAN6KSW0_9PEZI|nr:Nem1-Spo7 phosphatase regulatory subunit [Friedmanniomyces endolithicus]KAK0808641.1 Nem1-Spo7 phosphatase regulatory subunit [Friedmanniomyces endolithicus]KAK0813126.1 Nem1-Spo7 phosphatase regulatory subunit [Friedmanniomyces endolithicus]KAK0820070.1 Nem1-Spo7 phosphatase regulatory subunit [Friedmanniomyces endolithicus]KAK0823403.1 Nem1-Spo7 phosphatase regulatory subunit [Friedmanniomyces endolithicus]
MEETKLDQIVKGAPPPNVSPTQLAQSAKASTRSSHTPTASITAPTPPTSPSTADPLSNLPSSPPQIYLNLLILESSLRLQYLSLRSRLQLHTLLLLLLGVWVGAFTYLLFFRPREDGSGVGGSVYWVVETTEKLGWCGGVVTTCLFWGTGMYERGVRWPRKFVSTTNRGLRGFNMKVVVVKAPSLWGEVAGWLGVLDPAGWWWAPKMNFQLIPKDIEAGSTSGVATVGKGGTEHWRSHALRHGLVEEDIAPSGDTLKLLLLPKPFSPDLREGWETYRMEYWERENARRAELRRLVRRRQRDVAYREGGWLWWTGWRGWNNIRVFSSKSRRQLDLEKLALKEQPSTERLREKARELRRLERDGLLRSDSHSRSSSRSTTPTPEPAMEGNTGSGIVGQKIRRGSSSASTARRPRRHATGTGQGSRLSATETVLQGPGAELQRMSALSDGDREAKRETTEWGGDDVKMESAEA